MRRPTHLLIVATLGMTSACNGAGSGAVLGVLQMAPSDGALAVELNQLVSIDFDGAALMVDGAPEDVVHVTHTGAPVEIDIRIVDNRVEIEPTPHWPHLAEVDVVIDAGLEDADGAVLGEDVELGFDVRDGAWAAGPRVLANDVVGYTVPVANRRGDIVFPLDVDQGGMNRKQVVTYRANDQQFRDPVELSSTTSATRVSPRAAITDDGSAMVVFTYTTSADELRWARFDGAEWSSTLVQTLSIAPSSPRLGLSSAAAMLAWVPPGDSNVLEFHLTGSAWTGPQDIAADARVWGLLPVGDDLQVLLEDNGLNSFVTTNYDTQLDDFTPNVSVAPPGVDPNWVRYVPTPDGGTLLTYLSAGTDFHYADYRYDGNDWFHHVLGEGLWGAEVCENLAGQRLAVFQDDGDLLVAQGEVGVPLGTPHRVGGFSGSDAEYSRCFIDHQGNGHAVWTSNVSGDVQWSRLVDGTWTPPIELPVYNPHVREVFMDSYGNVSVLFVEDGDAKVLRFE